MVHFHGFILLLLLLFVTCKFLWLLPWPTAWLTWPQSLESLHTSYVCCFFLDTCVFSASLGSWSAVRISFARSVSLWSWLSWALFISSHSPSALSHAIGNIVKKAFFCTLSELSESHNLLGIGFLGHNYHNLYLQSCIILSVGFSVLMTPWMLFSKASTEVFSLGKSFSIF